MPRSVLGFFVLLFSCAALADTGSGIGDFADWLMMPTGLLLDFVKAASFLIGLICVFSAWMRFMQYRINPLMSPLSTVVLLLVIGIVLILWPHVHVFLNNLPDFLGD